MNEQAVAMFTETGSLFLNGLNERQAEAVLAGETQALQVLAGAGTGKTELISRRFVKLVKDLAKAGLSQPQEHILVVTFTNDAAASMRARIHQALLENGETGLGPDAWISNFHQFCMRLLRVHALEVGLAADFKILPPLEQEMLFERLLQGVFQGDYPDIAAVLEKNGLQDAVSPAQLSLAALKQVAIDDLEGLLASGRVYQLLNRVKSSGLSPLQFLETAMVQSERLTARLKTLPNPHQPGLGKVENTRNKLAEWQAAFRLWAHESWNPLWEVENKAEQLEKNPTASDYKNQLPVLAKFYLTDRTFDPKFPDEAPLEAALAQEKQVIQVLAAIYALYQDALLAQGACDFDDLINHCIALLARRSDLQARYREQFAAIVVDEFQDSNGSQLRLLSLLMRGGAQNLTVVGDEKQSIYAFRFAQPENLDLIFQDAVDKRAVNLQTNYRSLLPVLQVANHLTEQISNRAHQQLHVCPAYASVDAPLVTWVNLDGERASQAEPPELVPLALQKAREARFIAVEIARLAQAGDYRFSDVAVLVKSHRKAEAIQQALADLGIPAIRQKNLGFFDEPVIKDALALLRLMDDLNDDRSMVRLLQAKLNQKTLRDLREAQWGWPNAHSGEGRPSLLALCLRLPDAPNCLPGLPQTIRGALGDLAAQLLALRHQKTRLTPASLFLKLARLVGLIDPRTPAWQQKQQRISLRTLEKLLTVLAQGEPLPPTLSEVLATLDRYAADPNQALPVSEELSGEDAVRIMTVFAAKGLEFPVVFAAYTEKAREHGSDDGALIFDPQFEGKNGFGLILGRVDGLPNLKKEIYQKCWVNARVRMEAQRVFYVALTRARERLYVVRGSQSHGWTAPHEYPAQAVRVLSESEDGPYLRDTYWEADDGTLRAAMAALQTSPAPVAR